MVNDEKRLEEMIRRFVGYMKKRVLTMNAEKTKMMCKVGGKKIERVKKFNYLGYEVRENNKEKDHIKYVNGKGFFLV